MENLIARTILACTLSLILLTGCAGGGLLKGFRAGVASSKPFVQSLVTEGVISQERADKVTRDLEDGIDSAIECEGCLKAITVEGSAKQVAKAKCYFALAQSLRVILARNNIGGVPQLDRIANIIQAGIAAFEEYYRQVETPAFAMRGDPALSGDLDKELERAINEMKRELKEATKVKK
jgi:hypothetical protein